MKAGEASTNIEILLVAEDEDRRNTLRELTQVVLPHAAFVSTAGGAVAEGKIPRADVALVDGGTTSRATQDTVRFLRAHGFTGKIVILAESEDDSAMATMAQSLGIVCITRSKVGEMPVELGTVLTAGLADGSSAVAEVAQARRIFATGQAVLSLQHSINNPLAALLAEAQLLQLEKLTSEQRQAVDRMIELCRRIILLVRRLDALGPG